jgi:hypothetical protein
LVRAETCNFHLNFNPLILLPNIFARNIKNFGFCKILKKGLFKIPTFMKNLFKETFLIMLKSIGFIKATHFSGIVLNLYDAVLLSNVEAGLGHLI